MAPILVTLFKVLIAVLMTTHEPPSTLFVIEALRVVIWALKLVP